jgi:ribose 5-phosphate isomerase
LATTLLSRAGIIEVGLFCGLTTELVIGTDGGVEHLVVPVTGAPTPR